MPLGKGAQGFCLALWVQQVTLCALRSTLYPGLPLAAMLSWEPGTSCGSLPSTQSPTCVWISLSFCLPLSVLPRGWSLASEPWSIGGNPILCPSSLMLLGCLSTSFLEKFLPLLPSCSWFSLPVGNFMNHHVDRCAPFSCCLPPWITFAWLLPTSVDIDWVLLAELDSELGLCSALIYPTTHP